MTRKQISQYGAQKLFLSLCQLVDATPTSQQREMLTEKVVLFLGKKPDHWLYGWEWHKARVYDEGLFKRGEALPVYRGTIANALRWLKARK